MKSLLTFALLAVAVSASGGELDRDQPNVGSSESTIIVRVNTQTGAVEKLEISEGLAIAQAEELAKDVSAPFEMVQKSQIKTELDQEAGSSSWFWFCPTYNSYPSYGYGYGANYGNTGFNSYGNWYSNYYSYNTGNYNYYYYQPYYGNNYGYNHYGHNRRTRFNGGWR